MRASNLNTGSPTIDHKEQCTSNVIHLNDIIQFLQRAYLIHSIDSSLQSDMCKIYIYIYTCVWIFVFEVFQ